MRDNDDDVLVIGPDGGFEQVGSGARDLFKAAAGRHRLFACGHDALLLRRADGKNARLLLAGEIVTRTTLLEAVSAIAQMQWEGDLEVHTPSSWRRFRIAGGALKGAWSGVLSERLGEVMVSAGLLGADQLAKCLRDGGPRRRIGEAAITLGFLNREQLFGALRMQTQRTFQNALLEDDGYFVMLRHEAPDSSDDGPALLLHLPIQELLLESVQRIDEMALFRERIPNGECCPIATAQAMRMAIGDSLRPVMALADGEHSIMEIARALRFDEYQTTKRIAQLMQVGAVELRAERRLDEAAAANMIARCNQVLRRIFETVSRYGTTGDMHWTLDAWIRDTALSRYFQDALQPEGTIDAANVLVRIAQLDDERPLDALQRALHELASFAMLSAGNVLPRDAERSLSRLVQQKLAQLRSR